MTHVKRLILPALIGLSVYFALFGISMHLGIEVLLNMGPFSWIALTFHMALWRPEEFERLASRLRRRRAAHA